MFSARLCWVKGHCNHYSHSKIWYDTATYSGPCDCWWWMSGCLWTYLLTYLLPYFLSVYVNSDVVDIPVCVTVGYPGSNVNSGLSNSSGNRWNPKRRKRRRFSSQWFVLSVSRVYCVCRQPFKRQPMIQCESCDEWYHLQCLYVDSQLLSVYQDNDNVLQYVSWTINLTIF